MIKLKALFKSFKYAFHGVIIIWRSEQNFRIQFCLAVVVLVAALLLDMPAWKIIVILLLSILVLIMELINSILERLVDALHPKMHTMVAELKDIMAAAVLVASIGALLIGVILFYSNIALFFAS